MHDDEYDGNCMTLCELHCMLRRVNERNTNLHASECKSINCKRREAKKKGKNMWKVTNEPTAQQVTLQVDYGAYAPAVTVVPLLLLHNIRNNFFRCCCCCCLHFLKKNTEIKTASLYFISSCAGYMMVNNIHNIWSVGRIAYNWILRSETCALLPFDYYRK